MDKSRRVALITGASSGLGAEFARQLAGQGYELILVARRRELLEKLAASLPVRSRIVVADLADRAARAEVRRCIEEEPDLELLVNNAGFGTRRRFWEADFAGQQAMHEVHVLATVELTHAALRGMVARGRGGVINVASVAAFARSASNVSYCATKGWMKDFTEGLVVELSALGCKVKVQALCPGFTYTEFHDVLGVDRKKVAAPWLWLRAEDVVRESLEGLAGGKAMVIPGWQYRLFTAVFPRLPFGVRVWLQKRSPHTRDRL